jgi:hypothetical protein
MSINPLSLSVAYRSLRGRIGPKVADLRECGSIEELTLTEELKGDRSDYEDAHQCLDLVAALSSLATTTEGTRLQAGAPALSVSHHATRQGYGLMRL